MHSGNSFDLIRFIAACGVLFSHSFPLTGKTEPTFYGGQSMGSLCVFVFFAVSGYLVMTSWDRKPKPLAFAINRGLRIFPGLTVCLLVCAFLLGPFLTTSPFGAYLTDSRPYKFVIENLAMFAGHVEGALPGVFESQPIAKTINGSLWTIRYEIIMYITLLAAVRMSVKSSRIIAVLLAGYVVVWTIGTYLGLQEPGVLLWRLGVIGLGGNLLNLAPFFLIGALLARASQKFLNPRLAFIFAVFALFSYTSPFAVLVLWLALPYCVLTFAYHSPKFLNGFGKYGDFSYGMYLYAFPVQQTLTYFRVTNWWMHLGLSLLITLILAILSWKLVESPALKFKARFSGRAMPAHARVTA